MKKILKEKGVTLIALVITIIVLLILAGVSIATLTGDNGILTQATEAKEETRGGTVQEARDLWKTNQESDKLAGTSTAQTLDELLSDLKKQKQLTDEEIETIKETGKVTIGSRTIEFIDYIVKVGDYVNYIPDTDLEEYSVENLSEEIIGFNNRDGIKQNKKNKWRVLNINSNGTIDIIGEVTEQGLSVGMDKAYNNGVYVLNDICKTLYSNNSLGIEARSINLEDIESKFSDEGKNAKNTYLSEAGIQYGKVKTYIRRANDSNYRYVNYPLLYAEENGSGIDIEITNKTENEIEAQLKKDGIYASDSYYREPMKERGHEGAINSLTVKQTYYYLNEVIPSYFKDYNEVTGKSIIKEILFGTDLDYWVASRCVNTNTEKEYGAEFGLRAVYKNKLSRKEVFNSYGNGHGGGSLPKIRPVVTLGTNIEIIPVYNPDGSNIENMHQIRKNNLY